jgi:hypothetical protein
MTYGCHSKPRPTSETTYLAQEGWLYRNVIYSEPYESPRDEFTRIPELVEIKHAMTTECKYDASASDKQCAGCPYQAGSGK